MRTFAALAVLIWLCACASRLTPTETYIEQGEAKLLPETVVVGTDTPSVITADVLVKGEHKAIAVLASECNDGVGSIRVLDQTGGHGMQPIFAFASGDRPGDQLFTAMCEIRRKKMQEKPHSPP